MTHQLRTTAQGLMLFGTEMEKPVHDKYYLETHTIQCSKDWVEYHNSFSPICNIHVEHHRAFTKLALTSSEFRSNDATFFKALEQGIEIPSERVELMCQFCKMTPEKHKAHVGCQRYADPIYHAILLPEKKEEEKLNKIIDELREQKVDLQNQVSRNKQLLIDVCEYFTSAEDKDMSDSELESWIVQVGNKLNLAVTNYK